MTIVYIKLYPEKNGNYFTYLEQMKTPEKFYSDEHNNQKEHSKYSNIILNNILKMLYFNLIKS